MFMALSKFAVANNMEDDVKLAFKQRPHAVDTAPGFVRLEVLSPEDDPKEIWLLTYWKDRDSFETWHKSHAYRQAHAGIPKGLKLVPKSAEIRLFSHVAS